METLIQAAEAFARKEMAGYDGSHDWEHVDRVRRLAMKLAKAENIQGEEDLVVVELGALLHDVQDHKYAKAGCTGASAVREFLQGLQVDAAITDRVCYVVDNVSFSKQMKRKEPIEMTPELAVVQDADRLDSIGAVGVARCFTFGGTKSRALYKVDAASTAEKRMLTCGGEQDPESCVGHFYDKLVKIPEYLNTEAAKEEAKARHAFTLAFLEQLQREVQ